MLDIEEARRNMITQQLQVNDVHDKQLLDLLNAIPREEFVPETYREFAYADINIPIGEGQVMLKPMEEGIIVQSLEIKNTDTVLEIGTGTGYITAILACYAESVDTIEIFPDFILNARNRLEALEIYNVDYLTFDATEDWQSRSNYDVIIVTASLPSLPKEYKEILAVGGRLFVVLGTEPVMEGTLITRTGAQSWQEIKLFETVLPPMIHAEDKESFKF